MTENTAEQTNYGALITLTSVFFFWGFIAAGNSVFIPFCKSYFELDQFQSMFIDFAFYFAYYLGALGLFVFSTVRGRDVVGSWGYKMSIVYGLLFSALGAGAMIISVYNNVFSGMLLGLFIVALGFSLQQTSANPFMISLGDEATGSNRINLGGGINSLGTTLGPLVISLALFGSASAISPEMIRSLSLTKVIVLYAFVGVLFIGVAALFGFSKSVPEGKQKDETNAKAQVPTRAMSTLLVVTGVLIAAISPVFYSYRSDLSWTADMKEQIRTIGWVVGLFITVGALVFAFFNGKNRAEQWGAMQYPQLTLGMLAIFVYVGVEVTIGSNLAELLSLEEFGGMEASEIAPYVAMFWGSLMIGRWTGAINAFNLDDGLKMKLRFIVPLVAFGVVLVSASLSGFDVQPLYWYIVCVGIQIIAFYLTDDKPAKTLAVFASLGVISTIVGLQTKGIVGTYAFLSAGLFCSVMWPCIFSLSLAGIGKYKTQGAAFLVMMILGGAIIPPLQGKLADVDGIGIHRSFIVGAFCFIYLAFFAVYVKRLLRKQGINFD